MILNPYRRQHGLVLLVGLLLLLVMTLTGLAAARSSLIELQIAGNISDSQVAFQAAEGALREAERLLQAPVLPPFVGRDGLYPEPDPAQPARWRGFDWRDPNASRPYTGLAAAPAELKSVTARYFIERLPRVTAPGQSLAAETALEEQGFFRITARATGLGGRATVILQTTYRQ